jgi:hypothetical protein
VFVEKRVMKNAIIAFLLFCIGILYFDRVFLKRQLKCKDSHYRTNLTREEMKEQLSRAATDSISVMIPSDTSVMPYLIKAVKEVPCDVVRR